jgi:hypothetical protein
MASSQNVKNRHVDNGARLVGFGKVKPDQQLADASICEDEDLRSKPHRNLALAVRRREV